MIHLASVCICKNEIAVRRITKDKNIAQREINQAVKLATPEEFSAIAIGPLRVWPPVVLAPMAGVTNAPFRTLCREFGAGLYVNEMVTSRFLVTKERYALKQATFAPDEKPRSIQLYGTDPYYTGEAVAWLVGENRVDHIDLNFGCPVRKVTRKGGGAAIPLKPKLLGNIIRAAVKNAGSVPVTIKFRIGIDDAHQTHLTSGKIAEDEGCAAVALHARTVAQLYAGEARWEAIAELKSVVKTIPVLGNGDIWEARDALRMMRQTGCDGVVVGRGCLGRPWLFRDLADVFDGREPQTPPRLREVAQIMLRHARLLCDFFGERTAVPMFRKFCGWYVKGFRSDPTLRARLVRIQSLAELEEIIAGIQVDEAFPAGFAHLPRGKNSLPQKVALPPGYLANLDDDSPPVAEAEDAVSGG